MCSKCKNFYKANRGQTVGYYCPCQSAQSSLTTNYPPVDYPTREDWTTLMETSSAILEAFDNTPDTTTSDFGGGDSGGVGSSSDW